MKWPKYKIFFRMPKTKNPSNVLEGDKNYLLIFISYSLKLKNFISVSSLSPLTWRRPLLV